MTRKKHNRPLQTNPRHTLMTLTQTQKHKSFCNGKRKKECVGHNASAAYCFDVEDIYSLKHLSIHRTSLFIDKPVHSARILLGNSKFISRSWPLRVNKSSIFRS